MENRKFTKWINWENRNSLSGINFPGVYCISVSDSDLSNKEFNWIKSIEYIGMTNSRKGLKGRLNQFNNALKNNTGRGHGGADRFRDRHNENNRITDKMYDSVCVFECNVNSNSENDLRIMGDVAKLEYDCFADYVHKFSKLPSFNDQKNSPKFSSRIKK